MIGPAICALPGYKVELSPERVEPSVALPRDVVFEAQGLASTPAVYVSRQDRLLVRAYNAVAGAQVEVSGRLLLPEGRIFAFTKQVAPDASRTRYAVDFPFDLPADVNGAWLLNLLVVRSAGIVHRGEFFVQLGIFQGSGQSGFLHRVLASGYVGYDLVVNWPGTGINSPLEGPGALVEVLGTDPAAGLEISYPVPGNGRWRLLAMQFDLVTNAVVVVRRVVVSVDNGVSEIMRVCSVSGQSASQTVRYTAAPFGFDRTVANEGQPIMLPIGLLLRGGWFLRAGAINLDAGDNFTAPRFTAEEWIQD